MKIKYCWVSITLFINSLLSAQKVIPLYDGLPPNSKPTSEVKDSLLSFPNTSWHFIVRVLKPELTIYMPKIRRQQSAVNNQPNGKIKVQGLKLKTAVIICPGGGYSGLAIDHEGYDMAKKFAENGIVGIVLKYRLPNGEFVVNKEIVPLQDAQRAIQLVRQNAKKWGINPHKVGILGSSAGGHLASTAGTHFLKEQISNPQKISLRPDFMILNYPVISFADSITHYGSRYNLIGEMPYQEINKILADYLTSEEKIKNLAVNAEKIKEYSNELQVTPKTPPTFITHAVNDDVVPVQNSLLFIAALQKNKVPVESFFYAKGGHGFGMHNPTSNVDWFDKCIKWILLQ